jgi:DNA-binding GntR family transcriptional regulator
MVEAKRRPSPMKELGAKVAQALDDDTSREDHAVEALLAWLSRSETRPGEPVPLRKIAVQLGMSRTPVRTAIGRLREQGLVAYHPRLGFTVATPTAGDLRELFEIRLMIEQNAVGRLMDDPGAVPLDRLLRLAADSEALAAQVPEQRDLYQVVRENDAAFHQELVDLAGSRRLSVMYSHLHVRIHVTRAGWQAKWEPRRFALSAHEHRGIAQAIAEGDRDAALDRVGSHIARVRDMVMNSRDVAPLPATWPPR